MPIKMAMEKVESALARFYTKEYLLATISIYCITISKLWAKFRSLT